MNTDSLYRLYSNNINTILNTETLSVLSNYTNRIYGYNFINRLLIYIQNKYANCVMSENQWISVGRILKDKPNPIWIIDNCTNVKYVDSDTKKDISIDELSSVELIQALKLNVIQKETFVTGLKSIPVYSIKDTKIGNSGESSIDEKYTYDIKLSTLLDVISNELNIKCKKSDMNSAYNIMDNTLYIGADSIENHVKAMGDAVYSLIDFNNIVNDLVDNKKLTAKFVYRVMDLGNIFINESLKTLVIPDYFVDKAKFDDLNRIGDMSDLEISSFIEIFNSIYELVDNVICRVIPKNISSDIKLRKAAELLSILEANDTIQRIKNLY